MLEKLRWTTADYESLGWHDNRVHGLRILSGGDSGGELVLDLDHIVEWLPQSGDEPFRWRVAPATLTFHSVFNLRVEIDYAAIGAGTTPFSIDRIEREVVQPGDPARFRWRIKVNWPDGAIIFESSGFTQVLRAAPTTLDRQTLEVIERGEQ